MLALLVGALGQDDQDEVDGRDGDQGRDGIPVAQQLAAQGHECFGGGDHEHAPLPHMPAT